MTTHELYNLGIFKDNTEIFIRNDKSATGFEVLAKGYWYEDHMLDYFIEKYQIVSFTWQDDNRIYVDITI